MEGLQIPLMHTDAPTVQTTAPAPTASSAPVTPAATLPAIWYSDELMFQQERAAVWGSSWVLIGHEHQVRENGDYFTEDLAGSPVFVRRTDDELRGFRNTCPHRGGPMVWDGEGTQANLVCRYHGWAFRSDGSLLNARDFGCDITQEMALTPIQVDKWRGLVFVCLDMNQVPLAQWLGRFVDRVADTPFGTAQFVRRTTRRVKCNWKTYAENFLEGYHLPTVHPTMTRDVDAMSYAVELSDDPKWNIQGTPNADDATFGLFGYFFPSFGFDAFNNGFAIERWLPRGPHEIDLIFEYFFLPDTDQAEVTSTVDFSETVASEDALVCEHVQRSLNSGAYDRGILSPKWESAIVVFQQLVRDLVSQHK